MKNKKNTDPVETLLDSTKASTAVARRAFGKRIEQKMYEKSWNQSELARVMGIGRDSICSYINGKILPTPRNLKRLSDALGVQPSDLLPGMPSSMLVSTDNGKPVLEIHTDPSDPEFSWLRVNQKMATDDCLECVTLIRSKIKK